MMSYNPRLREWFQSTLPHGERPQLAGRLDELEKFQSTLPHGERLTIHYLPPSYTMFQSTLPHGERPRQTQQAQQASGVSIHAPAWGATL